MRLLDAPWCDLELLHTLHREIELEPNMKFFEKEKERLVVDGVPVTERLFLRTQEKTRLLCMVGNVDDAAIDKALAERLRYRRLCKNLDIAESKLWYVVIFNVILNVANVWIDSPLISNITMIGHVISFLMLALLATWFGLQLFHPVARRRHKALKAIRRKQREMQMPPRHHFPEGHS